MLALLEGERPLDRLVIDVRHNPGGNSDQALALFTTGIFGTMGPLRQDATRTIYRIRGPIGWNETTPIAVLIDGASNSAANISPRPCSSPDGLFWSASPEIKVTAFNLADSSLIRLAYTTLTLPDGSSLEGIGVQPDIRVPLGLWGLRQAPDPQLAARFWKACLTSRAAPRRK